MIEWPKVEDGTNGKETTNGKEETAAEQQPEPAKVEVEVTTRPLPMKGDPVRVLERCTYNRLSDKAVDCRNANAVHVQVIVNGTDPSATVSIESAPEEGGLYLPLPDPAAVRRLVTSNLSFEVPAGGTWVKVRLSDVSGTFGSGQGYTVIVTPYVAAGTSRSWSRGYTVKTATILAGSSQSSEVDLEGFGLIAIVMPASWDTANITYLAAFKSGGTFAAVYDDVGQEVTTQAAASRVIGIDAAAGVLAALRFIKLRSGTSSTPVNQTADRVIYLLLKD